MLNILCIYNTFPWIWSSRQRFGASVQSIQPCVQRYKRRAHITEELALLCLVNCSPRNPCQVSSILLGPNFSPKFIELPLDLNCFTILVWTWLLKSSKVWGPLRSRSGSVPYKKKVLSIVILWFRQQCYDLFWTTQCVWHAIQCKAMQSKDFGTPTCWGRNLQEMFNTNSISI